MFPVWEKFITKESEGQRGEALASGHTARMWQRWAWVTLFLYCVQSGVLFPTPGSAVSGLAKILKELVRSREGNGTPLQYSCLENPMDGGAWQAAVHGVAKSRTRLSDFSFTFHFHALEKEMATHSSVLAWRVPGTGVPGGLPSLGLHRVRYD